MTLDSLIQRLEELREKYDGTYPVDMITETAMVGQIEQEVEDIAVSPREQRVKLLPENF